MPVDWVAQVFTNTTNKKFDCNTLVFKNQGTQIVTIDGNLQIAPGQGFTYECYPGEINEHSYDIVFQNDQAAGCRLVVISKLYKPKNS